MTINLEENCILKLDRIQVKSAEQVYSLLKTSMENLNKEFLVVIYLNTYNCILKTEIISVGILNQSLTHPREIFRRAILENANSIILVHNHPTDDPTPSDNDIEITKRIAKVSDILGIKVLDHVIISKKGYDNIPIKYV